MRFFSLILIALLVALVVGCHTPTVSRGHGASELDEAAVSTGIDMKDWRFAIHELVNSMKASPFYYQMGPDAKTVAASDFINDSSSHLDVGFLREMLEEEMINSGRFRLVEEAKREQLIKTLQFQNAATEFFDASTVAEKGRQLGVQYFIQGKVLGNRERGADVIRNQYLIVVEMVDVSTAEKVFKKTVPVTKQLE